LRLPFYNNEGESQVVREEWELGCPRRVASGGDADSMLRFQLERGDDMMKYCQKMKRRQRARLDSMGRKRDKTWWCDNVDRRRCGTGERKGMR
jgi:hypothetical protein